MGLNESIIVYEEGAEDYRLQDASFIEGLPGIGLVSKVALAYILGRTSHRRLCRIYSPHFPSYGYVSEGRLRPHFIDIYGVEEPAPVIAMYGTSQPSTSYGQYELCWKIIQTAMSHGARRVFTLGGLGGKEEISQRRRIYCSSTSPEYLKKYIGVVEGETYGGQIVGAAGILMVAAGMMNLENMGMLVEIGESMPDYYAARRGVEALSKLCGLGLDEVGVSELITVSTRTIARLES